MVNKSSGLPQFGVAGFPPNFFSSEYKAKRENIFAWLKSLGLNWIELQNTYGVKMKDEQAALYRSLAQEFDIGISLHAPYYITLASADDAIVGRSKEHILKCFDLAKKIGSQRVIFHPGHFPGTNKTARKTGLERIIENLNMLKPQLCSDDIFIYPETAGKKSQIGSVLDIIEICKCVDFARPCIDVAHVHGFSGGALTSFESIIDQLNLIENELGNRYLSETHFHMYPVEIDSNGEKKHKAFADTIENPQRAFSFDGDGCDKDDERYYPLAEHFVDAIIAKNIQPVVVCEARDSQDIGALLMKNLYLNQGHSEKNENSFYGFT